MAHITVYSGPNCPYCDRAKALLNRKKAQFEEFNVKADAVKLEEMLELSGGRKTIPQIFIDGKHIGGCDDLYALDAAGGLDVMLQ
ncbi:MAG TPA: glutaredoxin 3 [Oculatellaceae cyanobacterium]